MLATTNSIFTYCGGYFLRSFVFMFISLLCVLAIFNSPAAAQGPTTGSFVGVVRDSAGRGIPNAEITFKNQRSGFEQFTTSDQNGNYIKTALPPGRYEITAKANDFQPKTVIVELFATQPNEVVPPITLQAVVVTPPPTTPPDPANPPQTPNQPPKDDADDDRERLGFNFVDPNINRKTRRDGVFNEFAVRTIPLGGTTLTRTFDELAFFVPGVAPPPQAIGNTVGPGVGGGVGTSGQFSVNGLRSRANNFTVDGSDNNDEDIGVRRQGFFTLVPQPIESVQEFTIITLLAPAEFGRNLGAQVNVNSKGGGSEFHGTLFGLFNADFLNARNFFDNTSGDTNFPLQARQTLINGSQRLVDACLDGPGGSSLPCPEANKIRVSNNAGEKDTFSLLQGGFAVGGPIIRNKIFFFASGEGQHQDGVKERHFAVPTIEQRGIFGTGARGFFGSAPNNTVVPLFVTAFRSEAIYSLFPFPNDPQGVYGSNTYTKALSIDAHGVILSGRADWDIFEINNNRQTLTARYNYTDDERDLTDVGGALFSAIRPLVRTDNFSTFLTGGLTNNVSNEFRFSYGRTRLRFEELRDDFLSPINALSSSEDTRFLLNAPYFSNNTIARCPNNRPPCSLSEVEFPNRVHFVRARTSNGTPVFTENSDLGYVGQVIIGGFSPVGVDVFNFPQERENTTFQFADTVRWQFSANGQHSLAFGTDIRRVNLKSNLPRNSRPLVTFYGGPCSSTTFCPSGFARPLDFVAAGAATGFFQTLVSPGKDAKIELNYNQLNFFVQDEWRTTQKLTFNFGVRYELNTTPKEADRKIENTFGQISSFPFIRGLNDFIAGRTNIYESDRDNFAPRLGFAYAPTSNTVFRGGFGMYYDQILGAVVSQSRNVFPTFITANFGGGILADNIPQGASLGAFTFFNPRDAIFDPAANNGAGLVCSFADLLAGRQIPCAPATSVFLIQPGTLNTLNRNLTSQQLQAALQDLFNLFPSDRRFGSFGVTIPEKNLATPFSYQYFFGVEQNIFKDTFLSVAYVGTTGRNLLRFTTPNLGNNYIARIAGVFYDNTRCPSQGISFCEPLTLGTTISPSRRVANVGSINQFETTGRSRYDSLQIELRGRLMRNFQYRTNYVFGKVKDNVSDVFDLAGAYALPQNSVTEAGEYAPANFDVRHRFTYSFIYDMPDFRDQNTVVRYLLGGWQIAGTGRFNTGQPFTVNSIFDVNLDGNLTDRLNTTNGIEETGGGRQPLRLTTNNLFSLLANIGQDGSVPRNSFRAGNLLLLDMSLAKRFSTLENQNLEVRFDVFNFINRANFGVPVRILEFPSFGKAVDTVTPGRRIQLVLRYNF